MRSFVLFLTFITSLSVMGQPEIDALKKAFPKQKGKEKAQTLVDLSFYLAASNPEEAKQYGRMAEKEAKVLKDSAFLATIWNDWSFAYFYSGDLDSSLLLNQQALEYRTKLRDTVGMGKSLNKIANTYYEKGLHDKCLEANLLSLDYFKKTGQEQLIGQVYTNIANVYERINRYEEALKFHLQAIELLTKYGNQVGVITSKINAANCYRKLGDATTSRNMYLELIPEIEAIKHTEYLAGVYQGLGVLEREQGNLEKGIEYYKKSLEKYEEVGVNSGISLVAVNLGMSYLDKKNFPEAEQYLKKGLDIALEMESNYNIRHAYKGLFRLETLKGNNEKADEYFELYVAQMDSIYNQQSNKAISEMKVKFDTEKKELALQEEIIKNKNKTLLLLVLIGAIVILIVIIALIIQRRKMDRQQSTITSLQNLETERNRIARDLHDNLGAELTMISSKLDMKAFRTTNEADKKDLEDIRSISSNANFVLRETIWSIHKQELTIDELYRKAEEYVNRILGGREIRVAVVATDKNTVLSPALALHLFRIIQEAINNASKYASCTELRVLINASRVEIMDNGKGFDLETAKRGYGLQNMEQRVKEFNGTITIESKEGKGTTVIINYA